jgi:hypothetical protein
LLDADKSSKGRLFYQASVDTGGNPYCNQKISNEGDLLMLELKTLRVISGLLTSVAIAGCHQSGFTDRLPEGSSHQYKISTHPELDDQGKTQSESPALQVNGQDGNPIPHAQVLIGARDGVPFSGNLLTADDTGVIALPTAWTDAQPVTIDATGYVRATYFAQTPGAHTYQLRIQLIPQKIEIKGQATGFGKIPDDDQMYVGLVFPAISRRSIMEFQMSSIVSSESDQLSIFGQSFDVPSNMSIPKQTQEYIFPVTFDKPAYRTYVPSRGTYHMAASQARFPFKTVVDLLRSGKSFMDVINLFEFRSVGIRDVQANAASNSQNIPVGEVKFAPNVAIQAPAFDAQSAMLALALMESAGDVIPTDLKRLNPNQKMNLTFPTNGYSGYVLSILRPPGARKIGAQGQTMAAIITPVNQSQALQFMPAVGAPQLTSGTLLLQPPASTSGINTAGTYAVYSSVTVVQSGKMKMETQIPQWELFSENWDSQLGLPEWPGQAATPPPAGTQFRWNVTFLGNNSNSAVALGPDMLGQVSHISRSAIDLQ